MTTTTSDAMGVSPGNFPAGLAAEQPKSLLRFARRLDPIMVFTWAASTMLPFSWSFLGPFRYLAAGYFAFSLLVFGRQLLPAMGRSWPLLMLPLLCIISTLWAPSTDEAVRKSLQLLLTGIVGVYAATRVSGRNILIAYFLVEFIAAVSSLARPAIGEGAWIGVYDSKNLFAINMFILYLTALPVALTKENKGWLRLMAAAAVPMALFLILMAESGTTTLLVLVATVVLLAHAMIWKPISGIQHARSLLALLLVSIGLIAAYFVIGILQYDIKDAVLGALGKDATLTSRTVLWDIAQRQMAEHPLTGLGANGYWRGENGMANTMTNIIMGWERLTSFSFHSSYYENGVNFGYPGFFATYILAGWIAASAAITWLRDQSLTNSAFLVIAFMLLIRSFTEIDLALEFSGTAVLMFIAASRRAQPTTSNAQDGGKSGWVAA